MASPLVARLRAGISTTDDLEQKAMQVAELACYCARTGEFDEAERLRIDLRKHFGDGRTPAVSIYILCLESLLIYYKELGLGARDKMMRANLLSQSFGIQRLSALTFAWLSHINFNQDRFDAMARDLVGCATNLQFDDGNAECRFALVLGDAFLTCGNAKSSRAWYERARRSANALGDHAAIGAITYNRAALRVSAARLASLTGEVSDSDISMISAEVRSATNYQASARLTSLDHLLAAANVGVLMLQQHYCEANSAIAKMTSDETSGAAFNRSIVLLADALSIEASLGKLPKLEDMESVLTLAEGAPDDDRAIALHSLAKIARETGHSAISEKCEEHAKVAIDSHIRTMRSLSEKLVPFETGSFEPA